MKVTTFIAAAIVAIATVEAAALPAPAAEAVASRHRGCWKKGEPCSKLKREAAPLPEAEAEPVADPSRHRGCWKKGEPCSKLKRALDAVAEAFDEPTEEQGAEVDPVQAE